MKKVSVLLGLLALFFVEFVLAAAVATTVNGTVQVQAGAAAARTLRQGDEVNQGDTIITGANSAVVLKFDDGQIAALTANSRLQVTQYQYNAQAQTGNVLLSLVRGGMRAITGLIGRRDPARVGYRAGTATIGIRGTDVTIATDKGDVVVTVNEGAVSFSFQGQVTTIVAGQGVSVREGQASITPRAAAEVIRQLAQQNPELVTLIGGVAGLQNAINNAVSSGPRAGDTGQPGQPGQPGQEGPAGSSGNVVTPTGPTGPTGGGAGGGSASKS